MGLITTNIQSRRNPTISARRRPQPAPKARMAPTLQFLSPVLESQRLNSCPTSALSKARPRVTREPFALLTDLMRA